MYPPQSLFHPNCDVGDSAIWMIISSVDWLDQSTFPFLSFKSAFPPQKIHLGVSISIIHEEKHCLDPLKLWLIAASCALVICCDLSQPRIGDMACIEARHGFSASFTRFAMVNLNGSFSHKGWLVIHVHRDFEWFRYQFGQDFLRMTITHVPCGG